jgi:Spy/CpxP family protein refolding chaperone
MAGEPRRRLAAALLLVAIFVAGGATGAGLMASFGGRGHHARPGPGRLPPPFEELGLSGEQRRAAEVVFERYRPRFEAVFAQSAPQVHALRAELDAELSPLLTDAQRARFEALQKSRPQHGPMGEPPPPPP